MTSLKDNLNQSNLNTLADALRTLAFGDALRALPVYLRAQDPAALAGEQPAALEAIKLPDDAKALVILAAYARTGAPGPLTVVTGTPAAGQVAVAPSGDIVFLAADAITDVDVVYVPESGDVLADLELDVAADVATIPAQYTGRHVVGLLLVEATTAGAGGLKQVLVPGAAAPAAGEARLNLAKTTVTFAAADAVTKCKVTLLLGSTVDRNALLEADSTLLLELRFFP